VPLQIQLRGEIIIKLSSSLVSIADSIAGSQNSSEHVSGAMFFAVYVGPSMNPTLREPEIMEIFPYDKRPFRVGDVVFFLRTESNQGVVHRIVRVTAEGISTLGDNNTHEDAALLQPKNIKGQVVAALRGQKRRKIAGGILGRLTSFWLRRRRVIDRGVSPLLHPIYQSLSYRGAFMRILPVRFRPRVVVFHSRTQEYFQLLMGQRVIGRYNEQSQEWHIQRPFQLFVDGKVLPKQQARDQANRQFLNEWQESMNQQLMQGVRYNFVLADGSCWEIVAVDEEAAAIVSQLGRAMQLCATPASTAPSHQGKICRLLVQVAAHSSAVNYFVPLASKNDGVVVCILSPCDQWEGPYVHLLRLSLIFAREAQVKGGILIHGALAERNGIGVILTAPSGTGKSTASNRLPAPWRSLCDDATLVVRDQQGSYWAHPWPTWSRFQDDGSGGSWDVQKAVPLKGIFFLTQAFEDRIERVGSGQTVSLLGKCVGQVSRFMTAGLSKEERHALHMEQFNNICALSRDIPIHLLHISLTGAFWEQIEKEL